VLICNAVDEIDDIMLWNGSEDYVNVRCECEVDKDADCEDSVSATDW
jgi:hypothetical protein